MARIAKTRRGNWNIWQQSWWNSELTPCAHTPKIRGYFVVGAEVRDRRLTHQRHQMSSERRQKKCKYLNLHTIIMSHCSLIATRNVHAKHNKLVCHVGYTSLRYVKQKQARKDYTNDQVQAAKSRVENLEILPAAHTQDRLKVRTVSMIWQIIIKTLSRSWGTRKKSSTSKTSNE